MGSCFLLLLFTPLESNQLTHVLIPGWGGRGGGTLPYERSGMLSSRRGVNFGLWCHLGWLGKTPLYFAAKVFFRVASEEI